MKMSLRQLIEDAQDNANELSSIARELNASTTQVGQTTSQVAGIIEAITAETVQASQIANDTINSDGRNSC